MPPLGSAVGWSCASLNGNGASVGCSYVGQASSVGAREAVGLGINGAEELGSDGSIEMGVTVGDMADWQETRKKTSMAKPSSTLPFKKG